MTPQLIYNHSIEDSDIHNLCEDLVQYSDIAPKYYERFDVKRGLRNADGSGVIAGITRICMVHGYVMSEGERPSRFPASSSTAVMILTTSLKMQNGKTAMCLRKSHTCCCSAGSPTGQIWNA